jgi:hypothetical protein
MKSFKQLDELLVGRCHTSKKIGNNTYAERRVEISETQAALEESGHPRLNSSIAIRLHKTDVVTYFRDGSIVLNSGGWKTSTTKDRINEHSPVRISQHKGVWTFAYGSQLHTFKDGVTLKPDGTVDGAAVASDESREKKLKKQIATFARLASEAVPLPLPGAGDCLFCQCRREDGREFGSGDHFQSHLDEGYIVPSLVYSALKEAGNSALIIQSAFVASDGTRQDSGWLGGFAKERVKKAVAKYLKRRLGLVG